LLEKLKLGINGMEIFGARTADPIQTCVDEVKKSKIFIGILGMRFGSIDKETGKSFVQIEYETAVNEKIDTLIYIINEEEALLPPIYVDKNENAKKLQDLKDYLRRNHTVESFSSPDDLAIKIERDIIRLMEEKGIVINEEKFEPLSDNAKTLEIINKFNLMPKKFSGKEIELIVEFTSAPITIQKPKCDALKLTYGASLSRRIKIIEPNDNSLKNFRFLKDLLAEDELCEFLYNAKPSQNYKIIAKLSFGCEQEFIQNSGSKLLSGITSIFNPPPIIDLDTKERIENYLQHTPIEALILVKII
jgi:hypothetical protein